ncbi:MAG TPA: hypothetical protein VHZ25_18795 [Acidobacteriaceae bacterium]|jgi:hypothetical protein|nr:hypothetical protein [Acidobacteriaceae bacterium]
MFESAIVDTAIGLIFVFLLMSLIASVAQELFSTFLQLRAANLQRGLQSLFSGDSIWGHDLVEMIYNHGLVRGLYSDPAKDSAGAGQVRTIDRFRMYLRELISMPSKLGNRSATQVTLLPAYIPSRTFALAMIDFLNKYKASGNEAMKGIHETLAEHNWIYRDNKAVQALLTLANDAKGDLDAFQKKLEDWYDDAMDRVSGWYKRYTQRVLLYIGIALAIGFNVDSIRIARTLWIDRDVRSAMVSEASSYVQNNPPGPQAPATGSAPQASQELVNMRNTVHDFNDVMNTSMLPIGWSGTWTRLHTNLKADSRRTIGWLAATKLPGWLITAFAISLGAPFWFDLLNKFMVVRSTIKPQEKSQIEATKD